MPMQDQFNLQDLQGLDPEMISAIYDRYFPEVYRFVCYRLNNEHAAEDIASDVFIRLIEALHASRGPQSNLRSWLYSTASHIVNDHLRKTYRQPQSELQEMIPDKAAALDLDYERQDVENRLKEAMTVLTEDQQYVLTLRFSQGFSLEDTAITMNKNVNAVKQLQFRALSALHRILNDRT